MSDAIEIRRTDDGETGAFEISGAETGDERLGELEFRWDDGVMVLVHTGVREALRGTGSARKLVMAAVEAARAEGFRLRPECKYAKRVLDSDPEAFADVRAADG